MSGTAISPGSPVQDDTSRGPMPSRMLAILRHLLGLILVVFVVPAQYAMFTSAVALVGPLADDGGPTGLLPSSVIAYLLLTALVSVAYISPARLAWRSTTLLPLWALTSILVVWALSLIPLAYLLLATAGPRVPSSGTPIDHGVRDVAYTTMRYASAVPLLLVPAAVLLASRLPGRPRRPTIEVVVTVSAVIAATAVPLVYVSARLA